MANLSFQPLPTSEPGDKWADIQWLIWDLAECP